MTPRRNPYGLTLCPNGHLPEGSHDHGDVAGSFPDARGPPERPWAKPAKRRSLIDEGPSNEQVLRDDPRCVLRVRHGRIERLPQRHGGTERRELKDAASLVHVLATDEVSHAPRLPRRHAYISRNRFCFHF